MNNKTLAQVFSEAADHMERVGLHKHWFWADSEDRVNSPCCMVGAVRVAADSTHDWNTLACDATDLALKLTWDFGPGWNDRRERTKEEVVAKLREISEKAKEMGR